MAISVVVVAIPAMMAAMADAVGLGGDDRLHVRLLMAEVMPIDRGWNTADVCSPYWRMYVNSRAGAEIALSDGVYAFSARRIHFVPAWVRFSCRCTAAIDHLYLHLDVVGLPGALVRSVFPRPLTLPEDRELEAAAERLRGLLRGRGADSAALVCEAKAVAYRALARALADLPADAAARCLHLVQGRGDLAPALRVIEFEPHAPLPNQRLARLCGLSEDHFIRRFRAALGQTPAQYVRERRIAMAAQRLLFSDDGIDEVAAACGFPERYSFTRAFARVMGLPPAAYRRRGARA